MRRWLMVWILACGAATARADDEAPPAPPPPPPAAAAAAPAPAVASPVRVALVCEEPGRTKMCPAFLLGLVDAHPVLRSSPRAGADVVVYATANEIALVDRVHLRFVGAVFGAPPVVELDVDLDTRAADDVQRAALEPAFLRGIALFVAAVHPDAVAVALTVPQNIAAAKGAGSPWALQIGVTASGNYTKQYRNAVAEVDFIGKYITRRFRALTLEALSGGANRQPPLVLEDGTRLSLDSTQWAFRFGAEAIYSFDDTWSIGAGSYTSFEDPKAQYDYNNRSRVALEWDAYPSDDPRGNRLAAFLHLGWAVDRYNIRNDLHERFATYPLIGLDATGSVRHDQISYGLTLSSDVQLDHPSRRHLLTASPFVNVQVGNHVDLNLAFSITQRELPPPDPSAIDPSDYAQLSRLSYAEPLSMTGTIGLTFHWDPTNGARNNRIESI